VNHCSI